MLRLDCSTLFTMKNICRDVQEGIRLDPVYIMTMNSKMTLMSTRQPTVHIWNSINHPLIFSQSYNHTYATNSQSHAFSLHAHALAPKFNMQLAPSS